MCNGLRVYPMIGNSTSEKPENLILPFPITGQRVTVFLIKEQGAFEPNGWLTGRDTTCAAQGQSKRVTILSWTIANAKVFNF